MPPLLRGFHIPQRCKKVVGALWFGHKTNMFFIFRDPIDRNDQTFAHGLRERRNSPGPTPVTRLKALLKAASD